MVGVSKQGKRVIFINAITLLDKNKQKIYSWSSLFVHYSRK